MKLNTYTKRALAGGAISMIVILGGSLMLGKLSGYEAKDLIQDSLSGLNTLCNTIVLASATILALLLTLLGLSANSQSRLKIVHYKNVLIIAKLDTAVFIAALTSFLIFNLPVTQSEQIPAHWYDGIYYAAIGLSSILSGALVVVVLMLFNTTDNIIKVVGFGMKDHPIADMSEEEKEKLKS
ncbi:hypothetical protein E1176_08160 [Fulvivirga sp. RKSG066]|uniref:hypothetical protein n=1 Tax=Fulvivirga aurantia TaxID=2529383 RepID=UPI0012BBC23C|nr:hypothetical protein [Fulvivirga aurantia]MTI20993.1 hypothetical protein [Fulvivirga aurantia]